MWATSPTDSSTFGGISFFFLSAPVRIKAAHATAAPKTEARLGDVRRIDLPPCIALGGAGEAPPMPPEKRKGMPPAPPGPIFGAVDRRYRPHLDRRAGSARRRRDFSFSRMQGQGRSRA